MKMTSKKMKEELMARLARAEWAFHYDSEKDTLRIEQKDTKKGINVSLPGVVAKWEVKKETAIEEVAYYVEEALLAMHKEENSGAKILPVIRSTSFPKQAEEGNPFFMTDHTAETRIYYALDSNKTYRLIDERLLQKIGLTEQQVREMALFNVRSLSYAFKQDEVAGNTFYFLNTNDGYDASRILNESLLQTMREKISGDMVVAVPHQDVLIVADIVNEIGYDIIAQMTMKFFAEGHVPITSLSFVYEDGGFEPIFILAKNRKQTNGKEKG
ncbi:DUF1444 domain-containing protein [Bacillus gaemokensis]|uniref:UPF0354 protein BAGA_25445 n=1 Tax=Bacillus gaemokensis TaxID=574375 RepID=A0A073KB64_9BACI|nr:DUF1444 domain-containing protein [Bacillus gaemokensis]KEK24499.1 hypothetical protein BAGA_25445 [Bacillus gaemokensis]KYG39389.1 hypothetical protein AZF08_04995 [Bacillus gaemokensis]